MSNRKKALIALATIEGILNLAIIVLFLFSSHFFERFLMV